MNTFKPDREILQQIKQESDKLSVSEIADKYSISENKASWYVYSAALSRVIDQDHKRKGYE